MITIDEVKDKIYNEGNWISLLPIRLGILKIKTFKQSSLDPREIWVTMRFNYWNPLTYIYIIFMGLTGIPSFLMDGGLKELWKIMKKELTEGIGFWIR